MSRPPVAPPVGRPVARADPGAGARSVRLGELLEGLSAADPVRLAPGAADVEIRGVAMDSRRVVPGGLFLAVRGERFDGRDFIADAARAGASAVLAERPPRDGEDEAVRWAWSGDARRLAAAVAARFHREPTREMALVGVTGTNGKTTVAWLIAAATARTRGVALFAGTVARRLFGASTPLAPDRDRRDGPDIRTDLGESDGLTTMEAPELQAFFREALDAGCRRGAVECSSHGLASGRLDEAEFEVAVFTGLTRDHLDFHGDMEAYYRAKRALFFDRLRPGGVAVVGTDGPYGARLAEELAVRRPDASVSGFGRGADADVRIRGVRPAADGLRCVLRTPDGDFEIASPLVGAFNAGNLAAAWRGLRALGAAPDRAAAALGESPGPPGRMERIPGPDGGGPKVFVDYAHSDDALGRALAAARELSGENRVVVVFGCGGDRDREKRALMGDAAARLADRVVITSDNPRSEDPLSIIGQIREGADNPSLNASVEAEPDRRRAIHAAIGAAGRDDVVLVAGRGHETRQRIGARSLPFSDREVAADALRARAAR